MYLQKGTQDIGYDSWCVTIENYTHVTYTYIWLPTFTQNIRLDIHIFKT